MEWFRLYTEFSTDPKVQSMSEAMQRRLVMLFCLRCSNTLETLQEQDICFALRIDETQLAETKALFMTKGFLDEDWNLMNWDKRQKPSDSSTERVREHRARKKQLQEHGRNVTETAQSREDKKREEKDMSGKPDAPTEIIEYLNGKTGRRFGFVKANLDLVKARIKEGATVETMKAVIDAKVKAWKGDPKMDEYLRPETLFGARKFAQYSGQLGGTGKVDWWRAAGFKNEWDAMNAGCTAVSAYLWRDGQKAEV